MGEGLARTLAAVADMLTLAEHLPEVTLQPGDVLVAEGTTTGSIWVLVSGSLRVRKDGAVVNTITHPGALIGEVSVLLGQGHTATVEAVEPTRLRYAQDGSALLASDAGIASFVAVGLAERLDVVTTYLADLKNQYGDAPGLAMVGEVLSQLTQRQGPSARPGSARDPDPEY
jgi:CRP/FNR family transcriptional regulator, cyclic AMP receptor protein